ncbi:DUF2207 family protein [Fusobacterium gastrosuis]|uniref:DUF2207 family protein n=1 Tax=Fusobacterium gastrosuis TaxID=1755100 RepID=UPI002977E06D|nr:DUF2207 domain-containing protein [Fusobacteriaceae bacterium]MDY5712641.1 DUF2207 domain-containing protein [Fusobacterium gastrosuis]
MKKNKIFIFLIFIFFNIISFAASYNITNLDILANLQKDGSMEVQEAVTYDIGDINGILFDIDTKGFGELNYIDIFEDVGQKNGQYQYKRVPSSKYEISLSDDLYRIKLYSKNSNNTRNFLFVYTLPNAVNVYNDVAQFNRKMVGENWQQSIDNVSVKINIPVDESYDNSKIFAFGHGPLTGDIIKEYNIVQYSLENYYPGDFVEAHILMEPEIFSKIDKNKIIHKNVKEELLAMEKEFADEANAERERAQKREEFLNDIKKYDKAIFTSLASFWAAIMFYIHRIFKKENKYKDKFGKYLRELPDDYSPALAGTIMTGNINNEEILATLLDLIRRKKIELEEVSGKNRLVLKADTKNLRTQENTIVDIYFNDFGDGKSVVLEDIKTRNLSISTAKKFEKWQYQILSEMDRLKLDYESLGFIKGALFFIIGITFFLGAGALTSITENPIFILLGFMGFILIPSSFATKKPNSNLQEAKARWGAFKNFLEDYSQLEDAKISSIHLWEQYFVYAVAMGVSEKVVKAYKKALEMGYVQDTTGLNSGVNSFRTLSLMDTYSRGSFARSINNVTKSSYSHSMSSISKSRRSSSSGGGGGFSSRSSGGGGSRGGGGAF